MHPEKSITRTRPRHACTECRRRKLKCDKALPCAHCVKQGKGEACAYERPSQRERRESARERLSRLEGAVQSLISSNDQQRAAPTVTHFAGATHWSAMLDDIQELKDAMSDDGQTESTDETLASKTSINRLFAGGEMSLADILEIYLPSKAETDGLVARYFRSKALAAPFLHATQFQRMYASFWADQSTVQPLWLAILFSILHISALSEAGGSGRSRYGDAAASCLILGRYHLPQTLAVEALLLFAQSQCLSCTVLPVEIGSIFGILIRLATMMGYHSEASISTLSPFEGEMRRRTWSLCMQLDMLVSFHQGLPSCAQYPTWDTHPPLNLLDADFDEGCAELPAPRPDGAGTEISFYIVKHRFVAVFEKVLRHTLTVGTMPTEAEADILDAELRAVYSSLPPNMFPRTMGQSITDSTSSIITRLCVSMLYNKCLCALHRPWMLRGRPYSIEAARASATSVVSEFADAYSSFAKGGQMEQERRFLGSLTWHDVMLGSTTLCLLSCKGYLVGTFEDETATLLRKIEAIISEQVAERSSDTAKVLRLVQFTLQKKSPKAMDLFEMQDWGSDWLDGSVWKMLDDYIETQPSVF